jgi:pseudo-rSAM protein
LTDALQLELIVNFPLNEAVLKKICSIVNKEKTSLHFIVENEEQYEKVEEIAADMNLEKYTVIPVYTGENFDFFKENMFLDREDIFSETIPMRKIFRNQKLNSNDFGTLYILPDGRVKANINAESVGNIWSNDVLYLLYREIMENTAWRKIRDSKPCNECLYQFFCPAPSDYERAIGRENLCHVVEHT